MFAKDPMKGVTVRRRAFLFKSSLQANQSVSNFLHPNLILSLNVFDSQFLSSNLEYHIDPFVHIFMI